MHVLVIGTLYEPDLGPSAPLFTMLSQELVKRGHEVTVLTSVPHYPSGRVSPEFRGKLIRRSNEKGVNVIRFWLPSLNRKRLWQRLIHFMIYQLSASIYSIRQKYDVVIAASSALSVWLPYWCTVVLRHKPAVYSVHDVYPDVGVALGIFKNKAVISAVGELERFCLSNANVVRILSNSFRHSLKNLGVPDSKMMLVYDWVDTDLIHPLPKANPFAQENHLTEAFVVLYAGNIGLSQGLETVLSTAEILVDKKVIQFVFVGDGGGRKELQRQCEQRQLSNVIFLPFQPRIRLPEVLASADVSLVILRQGIGLASLPSKTFSIMASGRPIIASVDEASETLKLIQKAQAGICIKPGDPTKLAEAIYNLYQDSKLREFLGNNGRIWAEQYHSPERAAEKFEEVLNLAIAINQKKTADIEKSEGGNKATNYH